MSADLRIVLAVCFLCGSFIGCSFEPSAEFRRAQVLAFEQGVAAFESKNYVEAEQMLTTALTKTTLHLDQLETAYQLRAKTRIELGDYEGAEADLNLLDQGATNMDDVWITRGELMQKQGDSSGAALAFREAKRINPHASIPDSN